MQLLVTILGALFIVRLEIKGECFELFLSMFQNDPKFTTIMKDFENQWANPTLCMTKVCDFSMNNERINWHSHEKFYIVKLLCKAILPSVDKIAVTILLEYFTLLWKASQPALEDHYWSILGKNSQRHRHPVSLASQCRMVSQSKFYCITFSVRYAARYAETLYTGQVLTVFNHTISSCCMPCMPYPILACVHLLLLTINVPLYHNWRYSCLPVLLLLFAIIKLMLLRGYL